MTVNFSEVGRLAKAACMATHFFRSKLQSDQSIEVKFSGVAT